MYSAPLPLSAGGMNTRSTSRTDPYGNLLPDQNQQVFGGGLTHRMTPEEAMLARQRGGQDFINNAAANTGILAPSTRPTEPPVLSGISAAAPASGSSNSTLATLMALLTGGLFGGSSSQQVQSGDTSIQENKGDTLGSITGFINNLLQTAMSGKTAADRNATDLGTTLVGHNANAALANQASKERGNRQTWVGDAFASLKPGYKPATVPGTSMVDTSLFSQGVPTQQIFGGGLGGADPTGVLGIDRPPEFKDTNDLMSGNKRSMRHLIPTII